MSNLQTFIFAPEDILFYFLKTFFSQETLYSGFTNQFKYTDGKEIHTLAIQWKDDYDQEGPNAIPALVISEGGFSENKRTLGPGRATWEINQFSEVYKTHFYHNFMIHCVAGTKGECKLLQAAVSKAIIVYRWALYRMGINDISGISGSPPSKIRGAESNPEMYDAVIQLQIAMDDHWTIEAPGDPEELISIAFKAVVEPLPINDLTPHISGYINIEE